MVAPVAATPGDLVLGVTMLQYPAYAGAVGTPFTAPPLEDGNGAACDVPAAPGSYGPTWSVGSGSGLREYRRVQAGAVTSASTPRAHASAAVTADVRSASRTRRPA